MSYSRSWQMLLLSQLISRWAWSVTENSISCSDQTVICAKYNLLVLKNAFIFSCTVPLSYDVCFTHIDVQFLEKFGVTFATEGETLTLKCSMLITPELKRLRPRAEWYRDGKLLHWIESTRKILEEILRVQVRFRVSYSQN